MKLLKNFFAPEEFTGWHMVGVMCLFFGTIISVNLYLAYQANHSWTGLVVKNSYHRQPNLRQGNQGTPEPTCAGLAC